jgi:hypothetical protein
MTLTVNQFLAHCEQTGEDQLAQHIVDNFISTMRMCNPDMKWMAGSDWLSVMMNDYSIEITDKDIQLIPKGPVDFTLETEFND